MEFVARPATTSLLGTITGFSASNIFILFSSRPQERTEKITWMVLCKFYYLHCEIFEEQTEDFEMFSRKYSPNWIWF
jgi:hypothetical protein